MHIFPKDMKRYESEADIKMRLDNCMLRYKSRPVWINQVPGDLTKIYCKDLISDELYGPLDPSDPDLDLESPPLGYVNGGWKYKGDRYLFHLSRMPSRTQKQGPERRNCNSISEDYNEDRMPNRASRDRFHSYFDKGVANTVINNFPDTEECFELIRKENRNGAAFHRKYAIVPNLGDVNKPFKLKFMTMPIGFCFKDSRSKECLLLPQYNTDIHIRALSQHFYQVEAMERIEYDESYVE